MGSSAPLAGGPAAPPLAGAVRFGRARQSNACCGLDIGIMGSSARLAGGPAAARPGRARQPNACARLTRRMQGAARDWQAALPPCFKARQCSAAERVRKTYGLQTAPSAPLPPAAGGRRCFKARQCSAAERVRRTYGLQPAPSAPLPPAAGGRPCRPALRPGNAAQLNACARRKVSNQRQARRRLPPLAGAAALLQVSSQLAPVLLRQLTKIYSERSPVLFPAACFT